MQFCAFLFHHSIVTSLVCSISSSDHAKPPQIQLLFLQLKSETFDIFIMMISRCYCRRVDLSLGFLLVRRATMYAYAVLGFFIEKYFMKNEKLSLSAARVNVAFSVTAERRKCILICVMCLHTAQVQYLANERKKN